jgi:predicted dehydrogenase
MTMNNDPTLGPARTTRREFLSTSGKAAAAAALAGAIARPGCAAENNTIKIALIGCGGRGTGAASQALSTKGPTRLWAMADFFEHRLQRSLGDLKQRFAKQMDVPNERQFSGLEGYKKAIDTLDKGDVALLATPPAFRPIHLELAVQKGLHVFMEKSFAVDAPGVRRVMKAGELARQKNLKIAGGLMSRHYKPLEEAVAQIHDGLIGEVITAWAYREHGPVGLAPKTAGLTELAHQIQNYSCFTWLNGSFLLDWLIHNIDVCCWVKNAWPVSAQGQGGRQVRTEPDQLFDHYAAEFHFPDGTRLFAQGRHISNCWGFFGNIIHGAKGSGVLGEGVPKPRLFRGHQQSPDKLIWQYQGPDCDPYQVEQDLLFDAIRRNKPYNEADRCAKACMTAILGRMACESGQMITFDEALNSSIELAPGLERYTADSSPPVMPDGSGNYPVAMPGRTQVL